MGRHDRPAYGDGLDSPPSRSSALGMASADLVDEPVSKACGRLQEDLRLLTRVSGTHVQLIEPTVNGPALPNGVAHAARAVVRGLILAMSEIA